jgi:osmotically-inducible protein OsmY
MRHPLSFAAGCALGAVAMYYLDPRGGAYRRSLVRDKFVAAGRDIGDLAQARAQRAADQVRGMMATRRMDRETPREPDSDRQLHDRVRAKLGHVVDHPKAIDVSVEDGCVCLRGHASKPEADRLVAQIEGMAGVREVRCELQLEGAGAPA